jgi:hypothetical protein
VSRLRRPLIGKPNQIVGSPWEFVNRALPLVGEPPVTPGHRSGSSGDVVDPPACTPRQLETPSNFGLIRPCEPPRTLSAIGRRWQAGLELGPVVVEVPLAHSLHPHGLPQHFLYFLPLPQGQGAFLDTRSGTDAARAGLSWLIRDDAPPDAAQRIMTDDISASCWRLRRL